MVLGPPGHVASSGGGLQSGSVRERPWRDRGRFRRAPNGDLFVAESQAGQVKVFRGRGQDGKPEQVSVFATGLKRPFGINFYPPGANPQWVYVGNTNAVVRFPYRNGDLKATGGPQTIVPELPSGTGHWTRDVVFSKDGKSMLVAVGSASNVDDADTHPGEFHRANILEYTPEGTFVRVYGSGIRNPVGLGVNPTTGELWCSTNERDALGDNLVPDYVTHVQEGGFYGWPWYYMGSHQDPRHEGKHPELKGKVLVPDVLLSPHNGLAGLDLLRRPAVSGGVSRRSVRRGTRVVEPVQPHGLRGHSGAADERTRRRRVRGFPHRVRHTRWPCVGPAGRRGGSPGWFPVRHR